MSKLSGPKLTLATTLAKPELIVMSFPQKQSAEAVYKEMEEIEVACKAVVSDAKKPLPTSVTKVQDALDGYRS